MIKIDRVGERKRGYLNERQFSFFIGSQENVGTIMKLLLSVYYLNKVCELAEAVRIKYRAYKKFKTSIEL